MKPKVCFLVAEHPFLDARIFKKEAKTLSKNGYDVTMVVPRINGCLFDIDGTPFTKDFTSQNFVHEGITIVTYEKINQENRLKSFHYNIHSQKHNRFTDDLTRYGLALEADIYHAHEFLSLYSGIGIKRALNSRGKEVNLIYDSHELVPDPYEQTSKSTKKFMMSMLDRMLREVDFVITVSDSIKSWYLSINPSLSIEVIYNSPPLAKNYKPKKYTGNNFLAVHEGFISKTRGNWNKILKITEICNKTMDFRFKIIGGKRGTHTNDLIVPDQLSNQIEIVDWLDYFNISNEVCKADIGWIDLDISNSLNNRYAMPNKFFSYLNNGVPVLVNKCTDMENFINAHKCGLVIDKSDASAEDYSLAINYLFNNKKLLTDMSNNARMVMEETYSWENMEKRLCAVYKELLN